MKTDTTSFSPPSFIVSIVSLLFPRFKFYILFQKIIFIFLLKSHYFASFQKNAARSTRPQTAFLSSPNDLGQFLSEFSSIPSTNLIILINPIPCQHQKNTHHNIKHRRHLKACKILSKNTEQPVVYKTRPV